MKIKIDSFTKERNINIVKNIFAKLQRTKDICSAFFDFIHLCCLDGKKIYIMKLTLAISLHYEKK